MLVVGDGREHDLDTERIVKLRIFVELAANIVDLVVVVRVRQVDLVRGDSDDRTYNTELGVARAAEREQVLTILGMPFVNFLVVAAISVVIPEIQSRHCGEERAGNCVERMEEASIADNAQEQSLGSI